MFNGQTCAFESIWHGWHALKLGEYFPSKPDEQNFDVARQVQRRWARGVWLAFPQRHRAALRSQFKMHCLVTESPTQGRGRWHRAHMSKSMQHTGREHDCKADRQPSLPCEQLHCKSWNFPHYSNHSGGVQSLSGSIVQSREQSLLCYCKTNSHLVFY